MPAAITSPPVDQRSGSDASRVGESGMRFPSTAQSTYPFLLACFVKFEGREIITLDWLPT